ncbi:MAG: Hsp70 family protein, partial [Brevundimonas sp.]|nr:Hsp70 family protein [Brevundimonas sp.]
DKATNKEQSIRIQANGGLSDDDIEKMVKEAEANAAADKARKDLVEAQNSADSLIHSTEKALSEHGDKIDEAGKTAIQTALDDLKSAKDGEDADAIREKTNTLAQASMKLGEAMYAASQGSGDGAAAEAPADDGVVDAEFEEVSPDAEADAGDEKKSA